MKKFDIETWACLEYSDILYIISKSLRDYRKKHNLTQKELADRVFLTEWKIERLEDCECNLKIFELINIWNYLSTKDENFGKELLEKIIERVNKNYEYRFKED